MEKAIEVVDSAEYGGLAGRQELKGVLGKLVRHGVTSADDVPESLRQSWRHDERVSYDLIAPFLESSLIQVIGSVPEEKHPALLERISVSAEDGAGMAMALGDLPLAARFRDLGGMILQRAGALERAEAAVRSALDLYRPLALAEPERYGGELARILSNLGAMLGQRGQPKEAVPVLLEALELRSKAAMDRPELPTTTLGNLLAVVMELDDRELIASTLTDALTIFRRLARERPRDYGAQAAELQGLLGLNLNDSGQTEAAILEIDQAVARLRPFAAGDPDGASAKLAGLLRALADIHVARGSIDTAFALVGELVDLCRRGDGSDEGRARLGEALTRHAALQAERGDWDAARETQEEVVSLFAALTKASPDFEAQRHDSVRRLAYINAQRTSVEGDVALPSAISLSQGRDDDRFQLVQSLGCPRCGTAFQAHVTIVIDTRLTPWFVHDIQEDRFNRFGCPNCGHFDSVVLPFIVNSYEQDRAVVFLPSRDDEAMRGAKDALISKLLTIEGVKVPGTTEASSDYHTLKGILGLPAAAPPTWVSELGKAVALGDEDIARDLIGRNLPEVTIPFVLGLSNAAEALPDPVHLRNATLRLADALGNGWLRGRCLREFGTQMLQAGRPQETLGLLQEALPLLATGGDRWSEAFCLSRMGLAQEDLGDHARAGELFEASASIFEEIGDLYLEMLQRYSAANMLTKRGLHEQAIEANIRVLTMSRAQRRPIVEVQCHERVGRELLDLGRFAESLPHLQDAVRMNAEANRKSMHASMLLDLGRALAGLGREDEAERSFADAQRLFQDLGEAGGLAVSANCLADFYTERQRIDEALASREATSRLLAPIDRKLSLLEIYKMGQLAISVGRREEGEEHFRTALTGFEVLKDDDATGSTLFNIGIVRLVDRRWQAALDLFEQSIARLAADPAKQANAVQASARCLWELDRRDEAEDRLSAAAETYKAGGDSARLGSAMVEMAKFAAARGDVDRAQAHLEEAFNLLKGNPLVQASVLIAAADVHETLGQPKERIDALERALPLLRDHGSSSGALAIGMELGVAQSAQGNTRAAERTLNWVAQEIESMPDGAIPFSQSGEDFMLLASIPDIGRLRFELFVRLAIIYVRMENPTAALAVARMALNQERLSDDVRLEAALHGLIAYLESNTDGNLEGALKAADRALELGRQAADKSIIAMALNRRSELLKDLGRYADALKSAEESLSLIEGGPDPGIWCETLLLLGYINRGLGRTAEAQSCLEKSRALAQSVDSLEESEALATTALALIATDQGRLQDALGLLRDAEDIGKGIGSGGILANVHANRTGVLYHLGDVVGGLQSAKKALEFAEKSNNRLFSANIHGDLGSLYWRLGDFEAARTEMLKALEIETAIRHPRGMAISLGNLGTLAMSVDPETAIHFFHDAVGVAVSVGLRNGEAQARAGLGAALLGTERYKEAHDELSAALAIAVEVRDVPLLARAHHNRSIAAESLGLEDESWEDCVQAATFMEELRVRLDVPQHRITFAGEDHAAISERFVAMNLGRGRLADAWQAIENSRSRVLAEQLGHQDWPRPATVREEDWQAERDLHRRMRAADVALTQTIDDTARGVLESEFESLRDALERVWATMEAVAPDYVAMRRGDGMSLSALTAPFAPTEVVGSIGFLEFFPLYGQLHVLIYRSGWDKPKTVSTEVRVEDLFTALERLEDDLLVRAGPSTGGSQDAGAEVALGPALFKDALDEVGSVGLVYLAPHGALHRLPLHMLIVDGAPLIERWPIAYVQSASVLSRLQQARHEALSPGESLVMGFARDPEEREVFVGEAEDVAAALGTSAITDDLATSERIRSATSRKPVIHLSCHGHFDPDMPLESSLDLADGRLTVRRIMEMNLSADLVTLSACETGVSRRLSGDEGIGIPRALLFAGATAALVSLWSVEATATRRLMGRFYATRAKMKGDPLFASASALRQACLELRSGPTHAHPHFWAPFELLGAAHEARLSAYPP